MVVKLTDKEKLARSRLCLALDGLETLAALEERVRELAPVVGMYKIGSESFTHWGPGAIVAVQEQGGDVFLDLKYHDIPETVRGDAKAATRWGVAMFNVHASGGVEMMKAAAEGAREAAAYHGKRLPKVLGVTVLTSIDEDILNRDVLNYRGTPPVSVSDHVYHLAWRAHTAGLDGVNCAASDVRNLRLNFPRDFLYVTPGIEGPNTPAGADQKRVSTPGAAIADGANILVVGRAITAQPTPEARRQAAYEILQDMAKSL